MREEKNMYFVPILIKAFESEEPIEAMRQALLKINELGKQSEYSEGFEQFNKFIESGMQNQENESFELIDRIIIGLISGSIKLEPKGRDELIEKFRLNQELKDKYSRISEEYNSSLPLSIDIYKNDNFISSHMISQKEKELNITNIEQGHYSIKLSNGRVLWEGEIKSEDINKSKGEYSLAADMEELDIKPTRTIELIKNEMFMNTYSGLEFGKIKIVIYDGI